MTEISTRSPLSKRRDGRVRDIRYAEYVDAINSPYPSNPFRMLRLRRGVSLLAIAELTGVTKQTLIRTEQGLFDEPPQKVMRYWVDREGYSELYLRDQYEEFQHLVRARHHRLFGDVKASTFNENEHPLLSLANNWVAGAPANVTEIAKLLCISQPLLNNWVRNPNQVKVPSPLLNALFQAGYSRKEMKLLINAYAIYRVRALI